MNLENIFNENILNIKKRNRKKILIGVILVIISFISFGISTSIIEKEDKDIVNFNDIAHNKEYDYTNGLKTKITINWISGPIDPITTGRHIQYNYFFASDGQRYYVLHMKLEDGNKLLSKDLKNNPVELTGFAKKLSDKQKNTILVYYDNTIKFNGQTLTEDSFDNILGYYYFGGTTSYSAVSNICMIIGVFGFPLGLFYIIWGIYLSIDFSSKLNKKNSFDSTILKNELNDESSIYYEMPKIFLTPNYIIIFNSKINYYKYSDIKFIKVVYTRTPFNKHISNNIVLILTNSKKVFLYSSLSKSSFFEVQYDLIYTIIERNPNIILYDNSEEALNKLRHPF